MKIYFKYGYSAFSGLLEQLVCQAWFGGRLCLGRRFTYPEITANNTRLGSIGKNLASVYANASVEYVADLKTYSLRNKRENKPRVIELLHPMPGPLALFVQMMHNWYDSDPTHVDLANVTVADIVALDADVRTIARAVDAEFLKKVSLYADLTSGIQ